MAIACFKESCLGKFEQDDKEIFCLKPARIRRESGATTTKRSRRNHMPAFKAPFDRLRGGIGRFEMREDVG
jgi:hypothetical protein